MSVIIFAELKALPKDCSVEDSLSHNHTSTRQPLHLA